MIWFMFPVALLMMDGCGLVVANGDKIEKLKVESCKLKIEKYLSIYLSSRNQALSEYTLASSLALRTALNAGPA